MTEKFVLYGQNVDAGSRLAGLTAGIHTNDQVRVVNTPNCENALVGLGFGMMLSGVNSAFVVKQQDFLLLSMDHIVNTYNIIRLGPQTTSFSIVAVVVDSGFEGPQSRLNNLGDFCSMAGVPGYTITNQHDADTIVGRHLIAPGFRIICVSQRQFREEIGFTDANIQIKNWADGAIFRYREGSDATIVCFNFSFRQGDALAAQMVRGNYSPSLFSVNGALIQDWTPILTDVARTRRLVILDDSRSINRQSQQLQLAVLSYEPSLTLIVRERAFSDISLCPNSDEFSVDSDQLIHRLMVERSAPVVSSTSQPNT